MLPSISIPSHNDIFYLFEESEESGVYESYFWVFGRHGIAWSDKHVMCFPAKELFIYKLSHIPAMKKNSLFNVN